MGGGQKDIGVWPHMIPEKTLVIVILKMPHFKFKL